MADHFDAADLKPRNMDARLDKDDQYVIIKNATRKGSHIILIHDQTY